MELFEQIKDYRDHMKAGVELADAAIARLLWVGKYIADSEEKLKSSPSTPPLVWPDERRITFPLKAHVCKRLMATRIFNGQRIA